MKVTINLSARVAALLAALDERGDVKSVIDKLIDHAQQGVYRPGAWERDWIVQAFGDEFEARLETDPETPCFQRPNQ